VFLEVSLEGVPKSVLRGVPRGVPRGVSKEVFLGVKEGGNVAQRGAPRSLGRRENVAQRGAPRSLGRREECGTKRCSREPRKEGGMWHKEAPESLGVKERECGTFSSQEP